MKQCSRCHINKRNAEFWKQKTGTGGLGAYCKQCCKEVSTEYRRRKGIPPMQRKEVYILPDFKFCSRCGIEKSKDNFRTRIERRYGPAFPYLNNTCRKCDTAIQHETYKRRSLTPEGRKINSKYAKSTYNRNKDLKIAYKKEYRNRPESKANRKRYIQKNKSKIFEQEKITKNRYHSKHRDNITDEYVIRMLIGEGVATRESLKLHPQLIEAKRIQIKIKRKVNETRTDQN